MAKDKKKAKGKAGKAAAPPVKARPPVSPLAPAGGFPDLPVIDGVRFAVADAGVRYKGRLDVMLAEIAPGATIAGVFTRSATRSAPVLWCEEKLAALRAFTERLYPGRWDEVRPPNPAELKATHVLALPLDEAVAKVRTGGPIDDAEDMTLPVWAGVVPLAVTGGAPIADPQLAPGLALRPTSFPPDRDWRPR